MALGDKIPRRHRAAPDRGALLAKFWCTDIQTKVVDRCLKIYGGTNEIMKELVARSL